MPLRSAFLLATTVLTGCMVGQKVSSFSPARGAQGVRVDIQKGMGSWISGAELLAIQDTALLVLRVHRRPVSQERVAWADQQVVLVPLRIIQTARFAQMGISTLVEDGRFRSMSGREQVRLVSRYPQGVGPELLSALLAAYGQPQLEVLTK